MSKTRLPGDATAGETVARMIRVDHAGEYGATRIYAGQLAMLRRLSGSPSIGENYFIADVAVGRVGADQPAAVQPFK